MVQHCFVCRETENLKMKTLINIALILTISVVVLSKPPTPPFCELTVDQLTKFVACQREKIPVWFLREFDDCKNELMAGTTDVEVLVTICEGEETGRMFGACIRPSIDLIEEELRKIDEECIRQVEA
ncbi:uncharacterized protein LOC111086028 [Limulus polyphemus]|uniref:Uncharacterized protein LOC111086028 n=1 Tax=Limulus polyphemus TaxID=6850 RepID=A0ABM1SHD5_LIMPO|nr:uncharacterized protein LOC111086028 [Limulus polyphemus]